MSGAVYPLAGNQRLAVDPEESVWLSASAGTGKTQVLSSRVLRLLLRDDIEPRSILCLTFTKAGAAEMAVRINETLARWVRLPDGELGKELGHLGAPVGPATRERARTLFASVLDCPGGGLRIDTIHAFSQWLLANFPHEAGLSPGTRAIEDRERELLFRDVLGAMLVEAEATRDHATLDAVAEFTRRKGPDALQRWLMRCASAQELWLGPRGWQVPMRAQVLQMLGLPSDASAKDIADLCSDERFDVASLKRCHQTLAAWDTETGREGNKAIAAWLARSDAERADTIEELYFGLFAKTTDQPKRLANILKRDPDYSNYIERVGAAIGEIREYALLLEIADFLTSSLELGRHFALLWQAAKTREGLLDFDDLIAMAARLLSRQTSADWIRYKLDRQFDHILIDEAQDTNAAQWTIIDALIDDFFSGEGAHEGQQRTVFTVGDYKQAIFGFQGTSPENFEKAKARVKSLMLGAAQNAAGLRGVNGQRELQDLDLAQSFRTTRPVLEFVDRAIEAIGWQEFGLAREPEAHDGDDSAGLVTLWEPVTGASDEGGEAGEEGESERGDESWLARHDRQLADRIARQVASWLTDEPFILAKGKTRRASAGDIMVLVRKRRELAALIVARLHARGVPVAGVDRLRLGAPLAVKDIMAALRFAAQPLDDLSLANLLVSPLIGWNQDDLLAHAPRPGRVRLWDHLRKSEHPFVAATAERLRELLARADFDTPQALIAWLLSGSWQGRRRIVARLGHEANDPLDELINAAFAYEASSVPSLAGFIHWFDAGEGELKRDPGGGSDQVRVMTVHGSKGLQAPIVILADATGSPGEGGDLSLEEGLGEALAGADGQRAVPLPPLSREERAGPIARAHEQVSADAMREHWRLLYVAMTRAEEALFIGGSLGPRERKNGPHEDSWYARLAKLFVSDVLDDPVWRARREFGYRADEVPDDSAATKGSEAQDDAVELPEWAKRPIGPEPRPPRPLAPSSAGDDTASNPPLPPEDGRDAARRGVLLHRLLERLPEVEPEDRAEAAEQWLARQAADLPDTEREKMAAGALQVLDEPDFAKLFQPGSLAEVPFAAVVGGQVVAGTIDRLLMEENRITVVDYKTTRRPPEDAAAIPPATMSQMAAYVGALEVLYPSHRVEAAVLYTHAPRLLKIDEASIAPYKARFAGAEESFSTPDVE